MILTIHQKINFRSNIGNSKNMAKEPYTKEMPNLLLIYDVVDVPFHWNDFPKVYRK